MKNESPVTIAIVDDSALMRESVKFRLSMLGYHVVLEAENGRHFLDQLQCSTSPDICLLDINMPVMDGFETALHLKQRWPGVKIVFFSMENSSLYMKKVKQTGADGFIPKDAPFAELNKLLRSLTPKGQVA